MKKQKKGIIDTLIGNLIKLFLVFVISAGCLFALLTVDVNVSVSVTRKRNIETIAAKTFIQTIAKLGSGAIKGVKIIKEVM